MNGKSTFEQFSTVDRLSYDQKEIWLGNGRRPNVLSQSLSRDQRKSLKEAKSPSTIKAETKDAQPIIVEEHP